MAKATPGAESWKSISRVQLYISEHNYAHGTKLVFDIGEISLLRLTAPFLSSLDAPHHVLLPANKLSFGFEVLGSGAAAKGSHSITARLESPDGVVRAEARQDLAAPPQMALALTQMKPGASTLRLVIRDAAGKECSQLSQLVVLHAGPLY
jgi:hypothetical protein